MVAGKYSFFLFEPRMGGSMYRLRIHRKKLGSKAFMCSYSGAVQVLVNFATELAMAAWPTSVTCNYSLHPDNPQAKELQGGPARGQP